MNKKTLLLNSTYEVLNFVSEKKMIKLLVKEKVEVISNWNDEFVWGTSGKIIKYPSILKMKEYKRKNITKTNFSRGALVKRDQRTCQYCYKQLTNSQITIDHVLPRVQGGITSFSNCVVSCGDCNNKKAGRTPEEAQMALLRKPIHPLFTTHFVIKSNMDFWHKDWDQFILD